MCMDEKKKSIADEFAINNFLNKEKEHANRWANQHRWRNGGRHISSKVKRYLKKKRKSENGKKRSEWKKKNKKNNVKKQKR